MLYFYQSRLRAKGYLFQQARKLVVWAIFFINKKETVDSLTTLANHYPYEVIFRKGQVIELKIVVGNIWPKCYWKYLVVKRQENSFWWQVNNPVFGRINGKCDQLDQILVGVDPEIKDLATWLFSYL